MSSKDERVFKYIFWVTTVLVIASCIFGLMKQSDDHIMINRRYRVLTGFYEDCVGEAESYDRSMKEVKLVETECYGGRIGEIKVNPWELERIMSLKELLAETD